MTPDQATHLRTMMHRNPRLHSADVPPPRLIAVSAGRPSVGASTISFNLAVALAQLGQRTVIVDADLSRADVAGLCGVSASASIADVLAGRRSIHEVLERGPGGIQLAAGSSSPQCRSLCTERSIGRLLSQLAGLGRHADAVVIDAGSTPTDLISRIWEAADCVLLVTTADAAALMDTYALTKSLCWRQQELRTAELLVNQSESELLARDIHARMDRSCQRFLGVPVAFAGWMPQVNQHASTAKAPWLLAQPASAAARQIETLSARLLSNREDAVPDAA